MGPGQRGALWDGIVSAVDDFGWLAGRVVCRVLNDLCHSDEVIVCELPIV